jgi:hypothetical protein
MEQEQPTRFATLPAEVRYHNKLTPSEKLLYAEITSLADIEGCCFARNAYFAELYNTTTGMIKKRISSLIENGFIEDLDTTEDGFRKLNMLCR